MSESNKSEFVDNLAARYQQILQDEGYGCKIEKNQKSNTKSLVVRYEGYNLVITLDYDDIAFVRIIFYNFYAISDKPLPMVLSTICEVSKRCKCGKVYMNNDCDDMIATVEYLENGNSIDTNLLLRNFDTLVYSAKLFVELIDEKVSGLED